MRYLCFVKMDESEANPPQALMEAMGEHVNEAIASGSFLDGGGLYGKADAVEFRVRGGNLTVTDGPYTEAKDLVGGFTIVEARDIDQAVELSRGCPILDGEGSVEVRPVMKMDL